MVHPKPAEAWRAAWFAWLIGKPHDEPRCRPRRGRSNASSAMPPASRRRAVPDADCARHDAGAVGAGRTGRILADGAPEPEHLARHGVFEQPGMAKAIAASAPAGRGRERVLPYQLMSAFKAAGEAVPAVVQDALRDAMELAIGNVPSLHGRVVVCPDVSGVHAFPGHGLGRSATSTVRCVDVAALVAAAVLRKNRRARVLPFDFDVVDLRMNPRGFGHDQRAEAGRHRRRRQLQRAAGSPEPRAGAGGPGDPGLGQRVLDGCARSGATATMREWETPGSATGARLVCIDIQPHATTQAAERVDILNVGGFSDVVFEMIANFAEGRMGAGHRVGEIER